MEISMSKIILLNVKVLSQQDGSGWLVIGLVRLCLLLEFLPFLPETEIVHSWLVYVIDGGGYLVSIAYLRFARQKVLI